MSDGQAACGGAREIDGHCGNCRHFGILVRQLPSDVAALTAALSEGTEAQRAAIATAVVMAQNARKERDALTEGLRALADELGTHGFDNPKIAAIEKAMRALLAASPAPSEGRRDVLSEKQRGEVEMARAEMERVEKTQLGHFLDPQVRSFAVGDRKRLLAILDEHCPRPVAPTEENGE